MQPGRRPIQLAIAVVFAVAACAAPGSASDGPQPSADPSGTRGSAATPTQVGASASPGALVAELRGARLVVDVPKTVDAGQPVTFALRLENNRTEPLQYAWNGCFAYVDVRVPLPTEPAGRTDWTGRESTFKAFALANAMQAGGSPATDPTIVMVLNSACEGSPGPTEPLAPGRSIKATFVWKADFGVDLPIPPRSVAFSASAAIYKGHGEVTPPPPPTAFPAGHWSPETDALTVDGTIDITGSTRPMAGIGEVIDGALADPKFLAFVRTEPFERCTVNLYLSNNEGTYLPHGPGWDVEVICEEPRHFIRLEVDPWTAAVLGVDRCLDPCPR